MADATQPRALILGGIGTLADIDEIECAAYNRAFRAAGLDRHWDMASYHDRVPEPGGAPRLEGAAGDAAALAEARTAEFAMVVRNDGLMPRPGIAELLAAARAEGIACALAATAQAEMVALVLKGLHPAIPADAFAFVGDALRAGAPKPAPDIHRACLDALGLTAGEAVAVEDTPEGVAAADAAGVTVYAYPARAVADRAFPGAMAVLDHPDPVRLLALDPCTGTRPITEGERIIDT